jgi:hypothetical protein
VCAKCGARGRRIDVRPNWKEKLTMPNGWQGRDALESLMLFIEPSAKHPTIGSVGRRRCFWFEVNPPWFWNWRRRAG